MTTTHLYKVVHPVIFFWSMTAILAECHGLLMEVAGNEVGQQRHGGPHSKKTWGQRSRLEQRPGCGYRQAQMANSCCPLSW